jgi:nucleotide-binding universal stress UspA family protein
MAAPIQSVIVGASSVDATDPAVLAAAGLARRLGATLHVVHAYDLPSPIQEAYARELFLDQRVLDRYGDDLCNRLETRVRSDAPGTDVVCHTVEGSAAECIGEMAREVKASLVVVGASRGSRVWQHFLGTTAEGVIRGARVPVLVLRRPLERGVRRVLLTTDFSPGSAEVHRQSVEVVRALFGEPLLRCLLAVQLDTMPFDFRRDLVERLAERELRTFVEGVDAPGPPPELRVRVGAPADEILAEAAEWQADLVAVGTHGRRGTRRFLLGSVAGATLRGSACNVLVVPLAQGAASPEAPLEGAQQAGVLTMA